MTHDFTQPELDQLHRLYHEARAAIRYLDLGEQQPQWEHSTPSEAAAVAEIVDAILAGVAPEPTREDMAGVGVVRAIAGAIIATVPASAG